MNPSLDPGRPNNPVFNANRLKLGTFCTNGKSGANTLVPECSSRDLAGDGGAGPHGRRRGLRDLVPYARWKGYEDGKPDHPSRVVMDPYTWAAGIAQATNIPRYSPLLMRRPSIPSWRPSNARPWIDFQRPLRAQCGGRLEQAGAGDVRCTAARASTSATIISRG